MPHYVETFLGGCCFCTLHHLAAKRCSDSSEFMQPAIRVRVGFPATGSCSSSVVHTHTFFCGRPYNLICCLGSCILLWLINLRSQAPGSPGSGAASAGVGVRADMADEGKTFVCWSDMHGINCKLWINEVPARLGGTGAGGRRIKVIDKTVVGHKFSYGL